MSVLGRHEKERERRKDRTCDEGEDDSGEEGEQGLLVVEEAECGWKVDRSLTHGSLARLKGRWAEEREGGVLAGGRARREGKALHTRNNILRGCNAAPFGLCASSPTGPVSLSPPIDSSHNAVLLYVSDLALLRVRTKWLTLPPQTSAKSACVLPPPAVPLELATSDQTALPLSLLQTFTIIPKLAYVSFHGMKPHFFVRLLPCFGPPYSGWCLGEVRKLIRPSGGFNV